MNKPFDLADLKERINGKILPEIKHLSEVELQAIVSTLFKWTEDSIAIHSNPYIKFLLPVVATIEPLVHQQIDKIDGQLGNS